MSGQPSTPAFRGSATASESLRRNKEERRGDGFDIIEWHRAYSSCQRFFLDHGQHEEGTHALASFVNIKLPCQWPDRSIYNSSGDSTGPGGNPNGYFPRPVNPSEAPHRREPLVEVSLRPYVRRLVVTGFAATHVLHGLFGSGWQAGVGPIVEEERRNYMFVAKAANWEYVKSHYDLGSGQTVPRLKPLEDATEGEIERAESEWSSWILMQDWLIGSRAPPPGSE